jgi:hypothetical protein
VLLVAASYPHQELLGEDLRARLLECGMPPQAGLGGCLPGGLQLRRNDGRQLLQAVAERLRADLPRRAAVMPQDPMLAALRQELARRPTA